MVNTIGGKSVAINFFLFYTLSPVLATCPNSTCPFEVCKGDPECEDAIQAGILSYYSTKQMTLPYLCFDPQVNDTPAVAANFIHVQKFQPNSSWMGVYLHNMHGIALSPLFIAHGHLSCTKYVISMSDGDRIALEMKHYLSEEVDFRFEFNESGWIQYNERYGCSNESLQVDNVRILDTDYESYVIIQGCKDAIQWGGVHMSGYLLLVRSESVSYLVWKKAQTVFTGLADYELNNYTLPFRDSLIGIRSRECPNVAIKVDINPLCSNRSLEKLQEFYRVAVCEMEKINKKREDKAKEHDKGKQEDYRIPIEEISCMVTMFVSMALALYWTHFSF